MRDGAWLLFPTPTVADPAAGTQGTAYRQGPGDATVGYPGGGPERWAELRTEIAAVHLGHLRRAAPNLGPETDARGVDRHAARARAGANPHMWHGTFHGGDRSVCQQRRPPSSARLGTAPDAESQVFVLGPGGTGHPGGSVTGGPGRNAAIVMLEVVKVADDELFGPDGTPGAASRTVPVRPARRPGHRRAVLRHDGRGGRGADLRRRPGRPVGHQGAAPRGTRPAPHRRPPADGRHLAGRQRRGRPAVGQARHPDSIEYSAMSSGRSDWPWPSGSSVSTCAPLAARAVARGSCISAGTSRPGMSNTQRLPSPNSV